MTKIGRNDKCACNSGKKYKLCCLTKDVEQKAKDAEMCANGQKESNEDTKICMEYLEEEYTDHKVIDITTLLNTENYRKFQIANFNSKVIMVAQKTDSNKAVFATRGEEDSDMMVLYRGSYRTFNLNDLDQITESIDKMIQTRMAGKEDK